jgi:hypothetical protein
MHARDGQLVASAPEQWFFYGYHVDPTGPGAFTLTTEFTLNLAPLGNLGAYMIWVFLDGAQVASAPLIMRRD